MRTATAILLLLLAIPIGLLLGFAVVVGAGVSVGRTANGWPPENENGPKR